MPLGSALLLHEDHPIHRGEWYISSVRRRSLSFDNFQWTTGESGERMIDVIDWFHTKGCFSEHRCITVRY